MTLRWERLEWRAHHLLFNEALKRTQTNLERRADFIGNHVSSFKVPIPPGKTRTVFISKCYTVL